jgi:TolB-like protein/tetratricopeptide (TPR) repeat protein
METRQDSSASVRFGSFELDMRARELRTGTSRIRLQEQPFEILRVMLERPGDVVTREELRDRLWPQGTFVDFEHSLNAAVKRLRAALGDDAENPRFVETLPRRGYRFIAKLGPAGDASPASALQERPLPRVRLAVLPFSNLTDDGAQEYFSDGLTEEMIAQLGGLCRGRIGVLARWSSMVFKGSLQRAREIGEALRAEYLLEGSVRREGDRVRITARLVETAGETHLWSETYDRNVTDCLVVQTEVAARIARSLAVELSAGSGVKPARPDPFAYQTYLKGRYHWNKPGDEGLDQAIAFYRQAIASAPGFGAAHAAIARARIARAEYYRELPRQSLLAARADATHAIEMDASLYEAHLALADATRMLDWNWPAAEAAYAQAIALNPSYESAHRAYGVMLTALGRHADAVRESEQACELDPLCLVVGTSAAWVDYAAGDYRAAIKHCRNTLDMGPDFIPARRLLGAACLQSGRDEQAIAEFESALAMHPDDPVLLAWLAHALATTGASGRAADLVARMRALAAHRYVPPYHLALAYVGLGDVDAAYAALDQAWLDRDPLIANVAVEPRFRPLHGDARFRELLARMRL